MIMYCKVGIATKHSIDICKKLIYNRSKLLFNCMKKIINNVSIILNFSWNYVWYGPSRPPDSISYATLTVFASLFSLSFLSFLFQWCAFVVGVLVGFAAFLWVVARVTGVFLREGWSDAVYSLWLFPKWNNIINGRLRNMQVEKVLNIRTI